MGIVWTSPHTERLDILILDLQLCFTSCRIPCLVNLVNVVPIRRVHALAHSLLLVRDRYIGTGLNLIPQPERHPSLFLQKSNG